MCNFVGTLSMRSLQICSVEIPYQGNLTDPARVPAVRPKSVPKLSQDCLIFAPLCEIIIICSILTPLLIPHSLMRLSALQHLMKTQFSKLWMSVGVYALTYPKSTDTLKSGTENASWASTITDSKETVTHNPHSFPLGVILRKYQTEFNMNGWKNYETWNVSLWIQNDETLYRLALATAGFQTFMQEMREWGCDETQDGVKWVDADYSEVQSMFNEMKATTDLDYWKSALVQF